MKLLIAIPAFNEDQTISEVVESIPKKIKGITKTIIMVVDDGSVDNTGNAAQAKGATVITHLINRGLGGTLKTIFTYAKKSNVDFLVTLDADGQHMGNEIKYLVAPLITNESDVIIGSRWLRKKSPFFRYLINFSANIATYLLFSVWTTDSQSGFRAFNKKAIQSIHISADGMEVSSEFFKEIYRNKLRFKEVPVSTIYTHYSRSKGQRISHAPSMFFQLFMRLLR